MPATIIPRQLGATLVVAATDSLEDWRASWDDTLGAYYQCDGTADEVEINAALTAALTSGGTVILLEGTYTLADPIVFPGNNLILEGQGRATFIDGDGLATTEHAISLTGRTNCTIKNLSLQTQDGGTKTCHCIFIDNGCNYTTIDGVIIVDSDSDGIHIEGTDATDITIKNCSIEAADDNGIFVDMDALNTMLRLRIINNTIQSAGSDGIATGATGAGCNYAEISGNIVTGSTGDGIDLQELNYSTVDGNIVHSSGVEGIFIRTSSTNNVISNNTCHSNGKQGIQVNGSTDNTITGNVVYDNTECGIELTGGAHRCTVIGNTARSNQYGIYFESSDWCTADGNVCEGSTEEGIFIDDSPHSAVTGNTCSGNDSGGNTYAGLTVEGSPYSTVAGNTCDLNGLHGIWLYHANYCTVTGNTCTDNNTGDGIHITGAATYNIVADNECYGNASDGIEIEGGANAIGNSIIGNTIIANSLYGISIAGLESKIEGNLLYHNGTGAAGTYHGIYLQAASDKCSVNGNTILDDGTATEDGIHLVDGAVECQINNNYVYNVMGSGICLTANNNYCQASNNHIEDVDDTGIEITGSDYCTVNGNLVESCGKHSILISTGSCYNTINDNNCKSPAEFNIYINGNCTYNTATGNNCTLATSGVGIMATGNSHNCTIAGNNCKGNAYGIGVESSNNCVVTGNTVSENVEDGIGIDNSDNCSITGNTCIKNNEGGAANNGIALGDSHQCTVTGNACDSNGLHGIYVFRGDYNVISGNSCCNQTTGDGINITGDATHNSDYNSLTGNVCTGNTGDGIEIAGGANANKNIVVANQLTGNGAAFTDGGTLTDIGHNITA